MKISCDRISELFFSSPQPLPKYKVVVKVNDRIVNSERFFNADELATLMKKRKRSESPDWAKS